MPTTEIARAEANVALTALPPFAQHDQDCFCQKLQLKLSSQNLNFMYARR
jgi:hypothetical protein